VYFAERLRIKHFKIAITEVLYKDKKLVERLENEELKYGDIEEFTITIYQSKFTLFSFSTPQI
jgi:hypothetical protein